MAKFLQLSLALILATTAATVVSESVEVRPDNAALVLGGFYSRNPDGKYLQSAELFGCPGAAAVSVPVEALPQPTYLMAASYEASEDKVLMCGGYSCTDTACQVLRTCYSWDAASNEWTQEPPLQRPKFNVIMAHVPNLEEGGTTPVPAVLGYGLDTQIWHRQNHEWTVYTELPDVESNLYALGCFMQYNGKIYSLRDHVLEIDPETWEMNEIMEIPTELRRSGMCSGITVNGNHGIFLRLGYWFNLDAKKFEQSIAPPHEPITTQANAMWTFRGKPTIFGNVECDASAECTNKQVMQFNNETLAWESLGDLLESRTYHSVVEVPSSFCEILNPSTPAPPPTTTPEPGVDTTAEPDNSSPAQTDATTDPDVSTEPSSAATAAVSVALYVISLAINAQFCM